MGIVVTNIKNKNDRNLNFINPSPLSVLVGVKAKVELSMTVYL
jgi:hypothetical protein